MESRIRILHLDKLKSDSELVAKEFHEQHVGAEIHWVKSKSAYIKALQEFDPDLVLSDEKLPGISYPEAFTILKTKKPGLPFILLSRKLSNEKEKELLKNGVEIRILKEQLEKLPMAVLTALEKTKSRKEKKHYEKEINDQEKKFKALIENSQDAIILRDEHFNIFYRSPSAEKMTGWSLNDLKTRSFVDLIHPDDRQNMADVVTGLRAQPGKSFNIVFRNLHKNGGYVWIEMTIANLLSDEHVKAIVCNLRDVTEQKNTETELILSTNHYKALIENISDAIVLTDRNGLIKYQSPSGEAMLGLTPHESVGTKFLSYLHPEDLSQAKSIFRSIISKPDVKMHRSFRIRHKNGHYIWVEGSASNLLKDTSVEAIIINYRDVTARRASERKLEKSEANLRSIFDNTSVSYVLINHEFRIVSFNQQAKVRYRHEINADITEGACIVDYLPEFRKEDTVSIFNKVLGGTKHSYEKEFIHEREISWYNVNMFPVYDDKKRILGLIISSEDITARKLAELEREEMTADLIQHNKNLEQFAYIITHNLRAPVANIVGLSSVMSGSPNMPAADFEKCLEGLTTSVKKLDEVIIDLNFILQNRKEVNNQREMVLLNKLLDDIKSLTSELLEKESVTLNTDFKVESLYTIKSYLHSIFINLITNSIKYRQQHQHPEILISSFIDRGEVVLRFKDNGLGIDLNNNGTKLFGLYKRFHKHVEGKGMGLYMVKTQVEMLGGKISVESVPDHGTTFEIRFNSTGIVA